jgi:tight adherence protein B
MLMLVTAVLLAAAAAALLVTPPRRVHGSRVSDMDIPIVAGGPGGPGGGRQGARADQVHRRAGPALVGAGAVTAWVVTTSALTGTQLAVAGVAVGAAAAAARGVAIARRADRARRRRRAVVDFCEALVGELRAGQPVLAALERSAAVWPEIGPALSAARLDADVPEALQRLARSPGADALGHLAAAWQLCAATGSGLVVAAGQVLDAARADAAALRQVEGEASSARATARLVAVLPVVVLTAGEGLGARPWSFLLGRPVGVTCLAAGVLLVVVGLAWIDRIAAAATSEA